MGEELLSSSSSSSSAAAVASSSSDRAVEQAIVGLKKGGHLLKYSRIGKLKFCPFRLSQDEKFLIWYSDEKEKHLKLSSITDITHGQQSKQLQPDRESQVISLVYANGEQFFDLICKDKMQAESWFVGLKALISKSHQNRFSGTERPRHRRGAQSCINSPASCVRRRQILGLPMEPVRSSKVRSLAGSPEQSFSGRGHSDVLSCSSDSILSDANLSNMQNGAGVMSPTSPYSEPDDINQCETDFVTSEVQSDLLSVFGGSVREPAPRTGHVLRDVYVWGEGMEGGFLAGGGEKLDSLIPKVLESTAMLDVQALFLGRTHASLVTGHGEVFSWGEGKSGRLGHKIDMDVTNPKIVESLSGIGVKSVAFGEYQMCAVTHSGELYTWGDGYVMVELAGETGRKRSHWLPHRVSGSLDGVIISSVACGEWHMGIISITGKLFTYGEGSFGALGHGDTKSLLRPKEVMSLKGLWVKAVACGPWHTAAVVETTSDANGAGKLFAWGDGDKGKLGHEDREKKLVPTRVTMLEGVDFVQVSCGRTLTVGLSNTGKVYTMGSTIHGQLGHPQPEDKTVSVVQGELEDEFVREVSTGSHHVVVLTSSGRVYTWGKGLNGQLGLGDTKDRNAPTLVDHLTDRLVEHVTGGPNSTAAVCLHKSISSTDQANCRGCALPFGITRKKHNCYNCGFLFCRVCCSKKSTNASLAPNKSKPFRVCDPCFNQLQRTEMCTPRPTRAGMRRKCSSMSDYAYEGKAFNSQTEIKDMASLPDSLPRWGRVPLPESFKRSLRGKRQFRTASQRDPFGLEGKLVPYFGPLQQGISESDKLLLEEVQRLRAQVHSLKKLCQSRKERIQERQQKLKEVWSLALEESANCRAAMEDIKSLTSRLQAMSEEACGGGTECLLQITSGDTTVNADLNSDQSSNILAICAPREGRGVESLCASPIQFSSATRSLRKKENRGQIRPEEEEEPCPVEVDPEHDWVEQYEPGVYITLKALPGGKKSLKRVRFSRRKFTEKEAESWWSNNQTFVCQRYNIDKSSDLNQD
ncbi:unnamed protein product [Cuscuta campestris]|uniref:FYVE-type domain-containing protein n=1 Tax=Cuscuta campestris TaxID=132261 RepID=A0A484NR19_9ASTE|nr:unnamed protein product [Cuscuta campestris]